MNEKNKLAKQYKQLKMKHMQLQEDYEEILGYLNSYSQHVRKQEELIRCLHDYIHWKALDDEFALLTPSLPDPVCIAWRNPIILFFDSTCSFVFLPKVCKLYFFYDSSV